MNLEYQLLHGMESFGEHGYGIKIFVASTAGVPKTDNFKDALYRIGGELEQELQAAVLATDKNALLRAAEERHVVRGLFGDHKIFVETIPNGYCSRACCRHLPWFVVTTGIGRIKIGWRKRVINIDWSDTTLKTSAELLFPDEDVTKYEHLIHAWSLDKAREYLNRILDSISVARIQA